MGVCLESIKKIRGYHTSCHVHPITHAATQRQHTHTHTQTQCMQCESCSQKHWKTVHSRYIRDLVDGPVADAVAAAQLFVTLLL